MSEGSKPHVVMSHDIRLDSDYVSWVHDVKQRYVSAQIKSAVKVNTEQLSLDLQNKFPNAKKFSARNLWNMKNSKLQQLVAEINFPKFFVFVPQGHHIEIVTKCKTIEESWNLDPVLPLQAVRRRLLQQGKPEGLICFLSYKTSMLCGR